ncbi:PfkB family carbohydrate kinase [Curtobacterium poinsettiae]|uniref:PfkB family carbohydrate kinase n=1 Tax=Curtobacterium TaxID=2034 RepID=UPI00217DC07F|nr:PfkB family carbohydrate kinase [Curtobacterium flaccumfaciens]MCS6562456.1 PfkB family carbohydrate kinase [Curtobacterium flaccumfaciens pv. poinsettiae]UXN28512.1 PfkB family carbohydrate kinase [Curtobacterium flaccumfaciens]
MRILGGTYRERVTVPEHHEDLGGSGFRAAAALSRMPNVSFTSSVEAVGNGLFRSGLSTLGIAGESIPRDRVISFNYLAPFAEPSISGRPARLEQPCHVADDTVLAFGMIEQGDISVTTERLIYDPQSITDVRTDRLLHSVAGPSALIANAREVRSIGRREDIEAAARTAIADLNLDIVVVKAGARGALVVNSTVEHAQWVGAIPTDEVWKIGSGDAFSAAFAHAWGNGASPIDATRVASRAAAWCCSTHTMALPATLLNGLDVDGLPGVHLDNDGRQPTVYLAGPFFTVAERWLVDTCRAFLLEAGANVFSPIHDVGPGAGEVAQADLDGLADSDVVLALLDGWDAGTLFETGWATAHNIPVVGVAADLRGIQTTMLAGTNAELHQDITTALYRAIWIGLGTPPGGPA